MKKSMLGMDFFLFLRLKLKLNKHKYKHPWLIAEGSVLSSPVYLLSIRAGALGFLYFLRRIF